jgi:hypothetical protein
MQYKDYFKNNSAHRRFRQQVGAAASRQDDFIRTLKFPLEQPQQGWPFRFSDAQTLFNTTEGIGKGSLTGLVFCVLLSGGRLFSKGANSQLHRISAQLPTSGFKASFERHFGRACQQFTPANIINYFTTEKRGNTGKGIPFDVPKLAGELYRLGSESSKLPEKEKIVDQPLLETCQLIATLILESGLSEWAHLRDNVETCLKAVDTALASFGYDFPQLATCQAALEPMKPDNSTLDFSAISLTCSELDDALMPYQVISAQANLMLQEGITVDKTGLQKRITTETHMAMSWLFNKGLAYWTTTPLASICDDYQLTTADAWKAERIQQWMRALPRDALYGETKYDKYRSAVGGKLDSWIANYWSRLETLQNLLNDLDTTALTLHPDLFSEQALHWFSGQSASATELQQLIRQIKIRKADVQQALNILRGEAGTLPTHQDIQIFESFSELLTMVDGEVELLNNRLQQELDNADKSEQTLWKQRRITKPKWLKALPKVPGLSGGVPDYLSEIEQAVDRYQQLLGDYLDAVEHVSSGTDWVSIVTSTARNEGQHIQHHPKAAELDCSVLAVQKLWEQYIRQVRKAPLQFQQQVIERMLTSQLFATPQPAKDKPVQDKDFPLWQQKQQQKLANALILNQKGRVYVSPFSRGRHQPIALEPQRLHDTNLLEWIATDIHHWQSLSTTEGFRMAHDWQILRARLLLRALPDQIEAQLIRQDSLLALPLPELLRLQLQEEQLSAGVVNRALNLYLSEMRGLLAVIFRESFFLRTRFSRVGDNQLCYRPKLTDGQWQWQPPEQWLRSNKPAASWLREKQLENNGFVRIEDIKAFQKSLGKQWNRGSATTGALLKELPHDWCLDLGMNSQCDFGNDIVMALDKEKLGQPTRKKQVCRLIGNTAFKGWLDQQLTSNHITHGDYTLIIEQHFNQALSWENGQPVIQVTPASMELSVALPITQAPENRPFDISQAYIGIDLGEAGIGYAVMSSRTHELIEFGEIPIRSTGHLISRVKQHRKLAQPRQKFTQKFDTSLMELRENVVGDTAHVINSLMHHFNGAPILESSVRNLAKGANQLQLVYDKVLNLYTYSDTDAHKAERKHFWCGAEKWEMPGVSEAILDREVENENNEDTKGKKRKTKTRNLILFPGSHVHPAGTSQVCSECGYNPYELLEQAYKDHKTLTTDSQGLLTVGDKQLALVVRQSGLSRQQRRLNKRAPYNQPLVNKKLTREDAIRQLRSQLRRAPESLRSRDTSQSRYHCVVVGCGHSMHADANAAINIVRKWIRERHISRGSNAG